ncbi:hypothetical protein BSKO_04672 [Bryopsis sp. KO-2023]|nr:hypothetical protein BSKO_04672 [Bryopsis sp. KO-2023]
MATSASQPMMGEGPSTEVTPDVQVRMEPTLSFYKRGNRQILLLMVVALPIALAVWLGMFFLLPEIHNMDTPADRHEFTFRCLAVATLMTLALNIECVAHGRIFTAFAVDPIAQQGNEPYSMKVNMRVLSQTVEQLILFGVALLGLASYSADGKQMRAVVATTVVFVISRWVYWGGYHYAPRLRTPGNISLVQSLIVLIYVAGRFGNEMAGVPGVMLCLLPFVGAEVLLVLERGMVN